MLRNDKTKMDTSDHLRIAFITSLIEMSVNLPLWTIKTRAQCDLPLTFNPAILYRGYCVALLATSVLTSVQIVGSSYINNSINHDNANPGYRMLSAFLGGVISGTIFSPIDLIATQQHKHNRSSYFNSLSHTVNQIGYRKLLAGMPATCATDGVFTLAYYGAFPYFRTKLNNKYENSTLASIGSGLLTGFTASLASHPLDLIKTAQQEGIDVASKSAKTCFYDLLYKKNGVGLFKAFVPRTIWATSYVAVAGFVADGLEKHIQYTLKK